MEASQLGPSGPNVSPWKMELGHKLDLEDVQIQHQLMEE